MDEQTRLLTEIRDAVQEHKRLYEERTSGLLNAQKRIVRFQIVGVAFAVLLLLLIGILMLALFGGGFNR